MTRSSTLTLFAAFAILIAGCVAQTPVPRGLGEPHDGRRLVAYEGRQKEELRVAAFCYSIASAKTLAEAVSTMKRRDLPVDAVFSLMPKLECEYVSQSDATHGDYRSIDVLYGYEVARVGSGRYESVIVEAALLCYRPTQSRRVCPKEAAIVYVPITMDQYRQRFGVET